MKPAVTIQSLAAELSGSLERRARNNGADFLIIRDGSPSWVSEVIDAAHTDGRDHMLHDDHRFEFVAESASALSECDDPNDVELAPEERTSRLTAWLHSRPDRLGWCDEAAENFRFRVVGLFTRIQRGHWLERNHVLGIVREQLRELAEEIGEKDDAEIGGAPFVTTIHVTQEHIAAGGPPDVHGCPLTLAMEEAMGDGFAVEIGIEEYWVYVRGSDRAEDGLYCGTLPLAAQRFVSDHDHKRPIAPDTFQIEIPPEYLRRQET
jgi:hypothetical protein